MGDPAAVPKLAHNPTARRVHRVRDLAPARHLVVPVQAGAADDAMATLKTYPGYGHGMLTVNAGVLNADLLSSAAS